MWSVFQFYIIELLARIPIQKKIKETNAGFLLAISKYILTEEKYIVIHFTFITNHLLSGKAVLLSGKQNYNLNYKLNFGKKYIMKLTDHVTPSFFN